MHFPDSIIQLSWPAILFQTVGFFIFIFAFFLARYVYRKISQAKICDGTLVDYYQKPSSRSRTYTPIFEFKDANGKLVRGRSYMGFSIRYKYIGAVLPIYYYQSELQKDYEVIINKFMWTYALPIYMCICALISFLLPIFIDFK